MAKADDSLFISLIVKHIRKQTLSTCLILMSNSATLQDQKRRIRYKRTLLYFTVLETAVLVLNLVQWPFKNHKCCFFKMHQFQTSNIPSYLQFVHSANTALPYTLQNDGISILIHQINTVKAIKIPKEITQHRILFFKQLNIYLTQTGELKNSRD